MKKFFQDFKEFAVKGNIIDMAVGVVIGGAFSKIVTALVTNIITPLISLLTGRVDVAELKWVINEAVLDEAGNIVTPETAMTYGVFIQAIIDFLIIALTIFIVLRIFMNAQKNMEQFGSNLKKLDLKDLDLKKLDLKELDLKKLGKKRKKGEAAPEEVLAEAIAEAVAEEPAPAPVEESAPVEAADAPAVGGVMTAEELEVLKEIRDLLKNK